MREITLLRAMLHREHWHRYGAVLKALDNLDKPYKTVIAAVDSYYQQYSNCTVMSPDELVVHFNQVFKSVKDKVTFDRIFKQIKEVELNNPDLLRTELAALCEQHVAAQIVEHLLYVVDGSEVNKIQDIQTMLDEYRRMVDSSEDEESNLCTLNYAELVETYRAEGFTWRLEELNQIIGPIPPGTLGHVFARPEVGKTLFAVSELTHMAAQAADKGTTIMYCGNEEPAGLFKMRCHWAFLGKSREWCDNNLDKLSELKIPAMDHLLVMDDCGRYETIERLAHKYKPSVLLIDQGPKVSCSELTNVSEPRALQRLYNKFRELAKLLNIAVITLGQADSASDGRRYLTLNNLDSSKVGIPGELDWAIGIGQSYDEGLENIRFLSICKNKLSGLLGKVEVLIDREQSIYK